MGTWAWEWAAGVLPPLLLQPTKSDHQSTTPTADHDHDHAAVGGVGRSRLWATRDTNPQDRLGPLTPVCMSGAGGVQADGNIRPDGGGVRVGKGGLNKMAQPLAQF